MTTTVVSLATERGEGGARFVHRSTIADGDTLKVIGLPVDRPVRVGVYPNSSVTVSSTGSSEASINAGTENANEWPDGAVSADTVATLEPGSTGIIITASGGTCPVDISA